MRCRRLIQAGHPIGLVIAGEGHLRDQLQQQINDLELQDHIRLCGFLPDPRELYRAIDLFVLSSLREGLPNVVLEAMASQRAVVATNCNGIPDLVQHERNGLIVPIDNEARAARRRAATASARMSFDFEWRWLVGTPSRSDSALIAA